MSSKKARFPNKRHVAIKYKVKNWYRYNQALEQRGNITFWFHEKSIKSWLAKPSGKPGGQKIYSNIAIETAGIIRLVFHLPYRQTEGFMKSLSKLMGIEIKIPDFSTLSRRMKRLAVRLCPPGIHKSGTHIIIDSSGISVHGSDELYNIKNRQRVKGYRILNISMNEHQEITATELTTIHGNDKKQVPKLFRKIHDHCDHVIADGNYDAYCVYKYIEKYRPSRYFRKVKNDHCSIVIPPRKNAKLRVRNGRFPLIRSEHMRFIREHGIRTWKKSTRYGIRCLVETAFSRYKRIFGSRMRAIN